MRLITDRSDRMAAIILAALLALVLSIAAANAGTCRNYSDGTDTMQACDNGASTVADRHGRRRVYGTPNAGFERYRGTLRGRFCERRQDND
jgi:hypothetical protein